MIDVPVGLSDDRSAGALADITNNSFGTTLTTANIDRTALALFNSPSLPGEPGKWLIPNDNLKGAAPTAAHLDNAFLPGTGRFTADMAVADIDYNATSKDTLALKYFYQHDPAIAPYSYSSVPGFSEHLDSGAQVASITNSYIVKSNLSTSETFGFIREKIWGTNEQPFGPNAIPGGSVGTASINMFGSKYFPGDLGLQRPRQRSALGNIAGDSQYRSQRGRPGTQYRRLPEPLVAVGQRNLDAGQAHTQLWRQLRLYTTKHHRQRTGKGTIATDDFSQMIQGFVTPGSSATGFYVSSFLQGDANRYYRSNQLGAYLQDKWQIMPSLSLTAGVRYDWDGGLTEKYGRLFNFDPKSYSYDVGSDTITNTGLIIAGNNSNGTKGVSPTTLTGRQWGIAPRIGAAWQPGLFHDKVVIRAGGGMYYDRGELFSYFSPGYAIGTVTGGPFGVNQQLPFVNASSCPVATQYLYFGYIPTCGGSDAARRSREPLRNISAGASQQSQGFRPQQLPSERRYNCELFWPADFTRCLRSRQQTALHHSTTHSTCSGSRAMTLPSKLGMSAIADVTRSFLCRSISPPSPHPPIRPWPGARSPRSTATATMSAAPRSMTAVPIWQL